MWSRYTLLLALLFCVTHVGVSAGEVKIGFVSDLTGPNGAVTREGKVIVDGYLAMINAAGGINGNAIRLISKDDKADPRRTLNLVDEAVNQDHVVALLNAIGAANTFMLMKSGVLEKHKLPLVGVFSGAEVIRGPGSEYVFHTRASYAEEIMKIARLSSTLGLKRVAVFYQDDAFGASVLPIIAKAAETYGFEVINKTSYIAGEKNFAHHARRIGNAQPQAIYLMAVPDAVIGFMKAYNAPKGASQIYTLSFISAETLAKAVSADRIRGIGITQVVPNPKMTTLPLAKDFQAFLNSPFGNGAVSNPLNFEVYMNVRLVVEALKMAGPAPTAEKMTKVLNSMNNYSAFVNVLVA